MTPRLLLKGTNCGNLVGIKVVKNYRDKVFKYQWETVIAPHKDVKDLKLLKTIYSDGKNLAN